MRKRFLAAGCILLGTVGALAALVRSPASRPSGSAPPREPSFLEEAGTRGLDFRLGHRGSGPLNIRQTLGTGAALWDYDGDGWLDVYLVGQKETSASGGGALFHNRGDGTFENRTAGSGLGLSGNWHGCAVADVDNDGRPDLLLTGYGDCRLFRNLGDGRFQDATGRSGLRARSAFAWMTSAAFSDVDRDGRVDLYIARYVRFSSRDLQLCDHFGVQAACGPRSYDPQSGALYLNRGDLRFEDVTDRWGLGDQHGKTLGVAFGDASADGFPEMYLANDELPGDLYLNEGGRRFVNIGTTSGTAYNSAGNVQGGMGVDWGDYNRDGRLDLFVATFQNEDDSLYQNQNGSTFDEMGAAAGTAGLTRPFVAFGTLFADYDNDGYPDLWIANGHMKDNISQIDRTTTYRQRVQLFRNLGGSRFSEVMAGPGESWQTPIVGRGLAVGDVDNDGAEDVLVSDLEGAPLLVMNRAASGRRWLSVRLLGSKSNRMGLGARVRVSAGGVTQVRECRTGGSFLSATDARVHFGLGSADRVDLEVRWPSGRTTVRRGVPADQFLSVHEGP